MIRLVSIGLGILSAGGLYSAFLRKGAVKAFLPWLIMVPILFTAFFIGKVGLALLFGGISLLCIKEFLRATGIYADLRFTVWLYLGVIACYVSAYKGIPLSSVLPFTALPLFLIPIIRNEHEGMLQKIALGMFALILFGWFSAHLLLTDTLEQALFLIIGVELSDAAAFLCGKSFGKRRPVSNLSPNKTLEGMIGAFLAVLLYVLAAGVIPFPKALLAAGIMWGGGMTGDLLMSVIKREIGVKDMGFLIPGHGGMCDRFDSLIVAAPLFVYLVGGTL